mgnify:CR=1 FL=1
MSNFGQGLIEAYPGLLEEDIWIDADGRRIPIEEMSSVHKKSVLKYLKRDLNGYSLGKHFKNGVGYSKNLGISKKEFDELKEIYELLVRKIDELEK